MKIFNIIENQFKFLEKRPTMTRSPQVTKELHTYIKNQIQEYLGDNYKCIAQDTKEVTVSGFFGTKKCDITIKKDKKIVGIVAVKVIRSSYKKNANNYFENMIGETVNLKMMGIKVMQVIIIPETVLFKEAGIIKEETINDTQLHKYQKLNDSDMIYKPDVLHLHMLKMDYKNFLAENSSLEYFKDFDLIRFLKSRQNLEASLEEFTRVIKGE